MSVAEWILLLLACLAGAVSPGPSLALLIRSAIVDGRTAGVIFGIAHGCGILMYACLVVTGLETLLLNSPRTLFILQLAGCGFLLWIAFKSIFGNRINTLKRDNPKCPVNTPQPILRHAREGFLIVFFNPKIAAFFCNFQPVPHRTSRYRDQSRHNFNRMDCRYNVVSLCSSCSNTSHIYSLH